MKNLNTPNLNKSSNSALQDSECKSIMFKLRNLYTRDLKHQKRLTEINFNLPRKTLRKLSADSRSTFSKRDRPARFQTKEVIDSHTKFQKRAVFHLPKPAKEPEDDLDKTIWLAKKHLLVQKRSILKSRKENEGVERRVQFSL